MSSMSVNQAATRLGWKPTKLRRWINKGWVTVERVGWAILIPESEVNRLQALNDSDE